MPVAPPSPIGGDLCIACRGLGKGVLAAAVAKQVQVELASITNTTEETRGTPISKDAIKDFLMTAFEYDNGKNPAAKKRTTISFTEVDSNEVTTPPTTNVTLAAIVKAAKNVSKE